MQRPAESNSAAPAARESFAPSGDETQLVLLAAVSRREPTALLGVLQYWLGPDFAEGVDA